MLPPYPTSLWLLTYSISVFCHFYGCNFLFFDHEGDTPGWKTVRVYTGELSCYMYSSFCVLHCLFCLSQGLYEEALIQFEKIKDTDFPHNGREKAKTLNVPRLLCLCEIRHVPARRHRLGSGAAASHLLSLQPRTITYPAQPALTCCDGRVTGEIGELFFLIQSKLPFQ